ncbi:methyl-accepting chemotaxis protein [Brachyspira hampsonii]|uniref:Chemotaxis protein n=2 Tax=Brachyspira hampsonii TaxID=1287055 RepID=A0AAC9TUD0_9SPIR|nr:methyl-accepting chemotaxis protein [Brachyspira hampsonii]ASJ22083.1 chemotaxis protein [Brachyspira hampsonii]ELV06185.1 methyl-accepting chemotaxis sensory transducer [Brachyspira hampsonii 30599]OEJ16710.1 chemotaxis protein [Brachyspira hampsonii]
MNIFSNLIYGYNITVIQLLAPIIGISLMSVFIMMYLLLSIKTRKGIYITISVTLLLILIYNIISLIIIFLGTYGSYKTNQNISVALYLANNIIILLAIILMPINSKSFISKNKNIINLNNGIFVIVLISSVVLIILGIIYPNIFFRTTINYYYTVTNSYYIKPEGLFYVFKNYIILSVFLIMFVSTLADMIINYDYKSNILMIISIVIALILIVRYMYLERITDNIDFDSIGFAIVISSSFRSISIFSTFAKNALESIKKESLLNNKLHLNLKTLNNIDRISEELNIIDRNLMDTSMFVFEIDKEAKDAYSIISSKIDSILEANDKLMDAKNSKKNLIKDGLKYTNTIFTFFDKYKSQMQEHLRVLNQTISNMKESDFSNEQIISLKNDLRLIKESFKESTSKFLNTIIESANQFKDVNNITESIYNTIEYIKAITNKTNLLSINAGIQASKAGFYGKSFSVVAKEIGSLSFEISKGTDSIEKMLTDIFAGLVMIENSSFYIKDRCKIIEKEINRISDTIDKFIEEMENNINNDSKKLSHFKSLEQYNDVMSNILVNQNLIVLSIKENISAMLEVQNNLNSKIEYQNQDIYKIFNNFNNVIKSKDDLNEITKKIGNYSSFSHTDIEALSNIINTHRKKSSFTFAPIISLLKKSS